MCTIVVGPQGADELYTDAQGRIKVKFHWQANAFAPQRANSDHSCWLRVMQRAATAGGGHQFIPRIGQEVLVGFLGNDIDRPLVNAASLYNGGVNRAWHPHKAGPSAHRTPQPCLARGAVPGATHSFARLAKSNPTPSHSTGSRERSLAARGQTGPYFLVRCPVAQCCPLQALHERRPIDPPTTDDQSPKT